MDLPHFLMLWLGGTTLAYLLQRAYHEFRWGAFNRANAHLERGCFEEALVAAEAASKRFPKDWRFHFTAAKACIEMQDPEEALAYFRKAEELVAETPIELLINRAIAKSMLLDYEGALGDINRALQSKQQRLWALLARSYIYHDEYNYQAALDDCNEALNLRATCEAYICRCGVYIGLNNLEAARADLQSLSEHLSKDARPSLVALSLHLQASLLSFDGLFVEAAEEQSKAIELAPQDPFHYINRAYFLSAARQLEEALSDLESADKLAKTKLAHSYIASNRARISIMRDDLDTALQLANEAVAIYERPGILCTRAAIFLLTGALKEAERDLERAQQLNPFDMEIYWWKGRLMEALGREIEAQQNKEKALEGHYKPYF
ncbi:MAG TPA: hypothetical protein PLI59_06990 [Candidatus Obscuribacter sp.]|nr:hypothetical protein [Candidatus Obscuribacter sp.]HMY04589.1 hypothetical protein [Candidatus Obscuribacter sp.]HMY52042.1 hypothetical protein [Candidatus Obscuribacter sp.]HNA73183.1 hypothetical protein [Candidatus Obscuribacter sp.]HNG18903.1 hypothetical protein [Candidatus Obscuribacter sp.]